MATEGQQVMYACSMNKWGAERFAKFHFGSFFNKLIINHVTRMFDIYINEYVIGDDNQRTYYKDVFNKDMRDDFKKYWGSTVPGFNTVVIEEVVRVKTQTDED